MGTTPYGDATQLPKDIQNVPSRMNQRHELPLSSKLALKQFCFPSEMHSPPPPPPPFCLKQWLCSIAGPKVKGSSLTPVGITVGKRLSPPWILFQSMGKADGKQERKYWRPQPELVVLAWGQRPGKCPTEECSKEQKIWQRILKMEAARGKAHFPDETGSHGRHPHSDGPTAEEGLRAATNQEEEEEDAGILCGWPSEPPEWPAPPQHHLLHVLVTTEAPRITPRARPHLQRQVGCFSCFLAGVVDEGTELARESADGINGPKPVYPQESSCQRETQPPAPRPGGPLRAADTEEEHQGGHILTVQSSTAGSAP